MTKGFFNSTILPTKVPQSRVPKCGVCRLFRGCQSPKMRVYGNGNRGILLVGEAPGADEDRKGIPFIGRAGKYLRDSLHDLGVSVRHDCWTTNAIICRPPSNRTPTDKEIDYCRPNLINTIEKLKPEKIILLGGSAVQSLISYLWQESPGSIGRWVGWTIPSQKLNAWIIPTFHPSYILRCQNGKRGEQIAELLFKQHLKKAIKLKGRPWKHVLDYKKSVELIFSPQEAATNIWQIQHTVNRIAFDFETNRLKPDDGNAEIVACSIAWIIPGSTLVVAISFPWTGPVIPAMKRLLESDVPKIGWNIKFEDRWCQRVLGVKVNNWIHDGMLSAHHLDNRTGITGLKFQAFVQLGFGDYSTHLEPYLRATKGSHLNRVKEVELKELLLYCGLDSLLEYSIGMKQMEFMDGKK